jgi:Zn-dependent protease
MSQHGHEVTMGSTVVTKRVKWPLERLLFALAGSVTLLSTLLAVLVSPWFLLLTAFAGVNQWLYVAARACPASMVLKRFGVDPQCRW